MQTKAIGAAVVLALAPMLAGAQAITFTFTGTVTSSTTGANGQPLAPVGSPVTGSFSYDPATQGWVSGPPDAPGSADYGIRTWAPPAMTATIGKNTVRSTSMQFQMLNDWGASGWEDVILMLSRNVFIDGQTRDGLFEIELASDWGVTDALLGLWLPTSIDLAKFPRNFGNLQFTSAEGLPGTIEFAFETLTNPPAAH